MKHTFALIFTGSGLFLGLFSILTALALSDKSPVPFESLESVTETGTAVFNEVQFIPGWKQDVWFMRQSHDGTALPKEQWDHLAIVVDKSNKQTVATFYQLAPEDGKFTPSATNNAVIPFKARCFACHANGPRAIRAKNNSSDLSLNWWQKMRLGLWNMRIKSYGRVESVGASQFNSGAPFKSKLSILAQTLELKTCSRCHSPTGIRNPLKLEHLGTARFLVKHKLMPPFPFRADKDEEALLNKLGGR